MKSLLARINKAWLIPGVLILAWLSGQACAATYGYAPTNYAWIDNSAHTVVTWGGTTQCTNWANAPGDDDGTAPINIGFTFTYGATAYTQLRINSNGRLQFNNNYCGYGTQTVGPPPTYIYPYPDANLNNTLRIYGADFCPNAASPNGGAGCPGYPGIGKVTYATLGTAPNRSFVVTWSNMKEWNSGNSVFNMQIILYEGGDFVYQYQNIANYSQGDAQIGWQLGTTDYDLVDTSTISSLSFSALRFFKPTTPIAEYRLDDCSGTVAKDASGNGRDGTLTGGASLGSSGRICAAGSFNGNTSYIALPNTFPKLGSETGYTNFTITAWINSTNAAKSGQRIYVDDQNNNTGLTGGFAVSLGDGGNGMVRFFSRAVEPTWLDSPAVVGSNNWYFVVATHDATTKKRRLMIHDAGGSLLSDSNDTYTGTWGADTGNAAIGGENSSSNENSSDYRFQGRIDETRIYNRVLADAEITAILANESQGLNRDGSLRACAVCGATLGAFNAFDSSASSGAINGVIRTKIAGQSFSASNYSLTIVALNAARTAVNTSYDSSSLTITLLDAANETGSADVNGCFAGTTTIATLNNQTINNGVGTINPTVANSYPRVRVKITGGTSIGCSADLFAIRPAYINSVGAPTQDSNWQTAGTTNTLTNAVASGGVVHAAGKPFTLSGLTARNAANATTTNYTGTPTLIPGNMLLPDPSVCLTCSPGVFSAGTSFVNGVLTSNSASYSEVGAFSWEVEDRSFADVDVADSTKAQRYFGSNAVITTGRFVPDHFDTFVSQACGTFTYSGQPFPLTIKAMNSSGAVTQNYTGSLAKQVTLSDVNATAGTFKPANPLAASVFVNGVADLSTAPSVNFAFTNKLTAPATLKLRAKDQDTISLTPDGGPAVEGTLPLLRSGRLRLLNSYGSELLDVRVPLRIESYTGTSWALSTADGCTAIPNSAFAISGGLTPTIKSASPVALSGGQGVLVFNKTSTAGIFDLAANLNASGSDTSCNPTHGGTAANLPWLQGFWSAPASCGTVAAWLQDPSARIRLGSPKAPYIYLRENY